MPLPRSAIDKSPPANCFDNSIAGKSPSARNDPTQMTPVISWAVICGTQRESADLTIRNAIGSRRHTPASTPLSRNQRDYESPLPKPLKPPMDGADHRISDGSRWRDYHHHQSACDLAMSLPLEVSADSAGCIGCFALKITVGRAIIKTQDLAYLQTGYLFDHCYDTVAAADRDGLPPLKIWRRWLATQRIRSG